MPVAVDCACGAKFKLKDEFAGKRLKCPKCSGPIIAPALVNGTPMGVGSVDLPPVAPPAPSAPPPPLPLTYAAPRLSDPTDLFGRDRFLLRQKHLSVSTKYYVWDDQGRTIAFIERPAHLFQNLLALVVGLAAGVILGGGLGVGGAMAAEGHQELQAILGVVGALVGITAAVIVGVAMSAKRHIYFYGDDARTAKLLEITQDNKWQILNAYYTVRTPAGETIARLRKNYLFNLIRKRWYVLAPGAPASTEPGEMLAIAKEDSILLSLLRRVIGGAIGSMIRTNFIILQGTTEHVIGEFNRKFTLLDRYVLDMSADPGHTLDRRIALALGVLLDTGERR
jgi:hypothetical protein